MAALWSELTRIRRLPHCHRSHRSDRVDRIFQLEQCKAIENRACVYHQSPPSWRPLCKSPPPHTHHVWGCENTLSFSLTHTHTHPLEIKLPWFSSRTCQRNPSSTFRTASASSSDEQGAPAIIRRTRLYATAPQHWIPPRSILRLFARGATQTLSGSKCVTSHYIERDNSHTVRRLAP